ncbi:transcription termination factor Rho [Candidatus Gromoviella agglomerans]|uniref:transcription termination factor Rho n=1 Tax=Candidatus Gromoviella agglomerans TaxID=2806609 RepID=UPI003B75BB2F
MILESLISSSYLDLEKIAKKKEIQDDFLNQRDLIFGIINSTKESVISNGVLHVFQEGFGFLRYKESNYLPSGFDIYISPQQIVNFGLRTGDFITCEIFHQNKSDRYFSCKEILQINLETAKKASMRAGIKRFGDLTPIYPSRRINLHLEKDSDVTLRLIDLIAPIGFGQRGLIVAPPKAGKTTILQKLAKAVEENHKDVHLMILLIDERPEEVTDMMRSVKAEIISSTFDEPPSRHVMVAEILLERAKRMVEMKKDVVIILDGITRLSRAYNSFIPSSGRVLTGGVDSTALQKPKRFFGAARNIEEGGSLTIIATALVETGSKMDEVIFEEFKGTGNMELVLDRRLQEKRIFPCIEINKSGTRKEDLLFSNDEISRVRILRKVISPMGAVEGMDFLIDKIKKSSSNEEFFHQMNT